MDENNNNQWNQGNDFDANGNNSNNGNQNTYNYAPNNGKSDKSKIVAGLLGIFLGSLGIHKFYLGYQKEGLIMLLVSLLTCGIGASIMAIIGLIEGIVYLTKTDEDFVNTYVYNQKTWF